MTATGGQHGNQWTADANAQTFTVGNAQDFDTIVCFTLWAFNDAGRSFGGLDCANPDVELKAIGR